MTDLRTAAQAVLDKWKTDGVLLDWVYEDVELIEALRQALAEPVEPVGYVISDPDGFVPVDYIAPPSVDALIAEIDALDRHGDDADFIYGWDINPILDKYRGQK